MPQALEAEVHDVKLEAQILKERSKKKSMELERFFERVSDEAASVLSGDRVGGD